MTGRFIVFEGGEGVGKSTQSRLLAEALRARIVASEDALAAAEAIGHVKAQGVGMGIGSKLSGMVLDAYTANGIHDWQSVWMVPAAIAALVLLLFIVFFKDRKAAA